MEPRPSERGNATAMAALATYLTGFNGATSFRTWKLPANAGIRRRVNRLQWSHVLPNVETTEVDERLEKKDNASMEPRPSERGNVSTVLTLGGDPPMLQWSHVLPNVET